jgi:hypothetical protein
MSRQAQIVPGARRSLHDPQLGDLNLFRAAGLKFSSAFPRPPIPPRPPSPPASAGATAAEQSDAACAGAPVAAGPASRYFGNETDPTNMGKTR